MNHILVRLLAALVACAALTGHARTAAQAVSSPSATQARPLWPQLASDIAPDKSVKYGVLPNGMRYALMQNQLPKGSISIRFSFEVGSLNEADNEKGLAHFIEHMAFNGSTHVPEGEMVRTLERLGLDFGADTNASTGRKFTTYMLELPNASDTLVNESLFLMREVASELTFDAEAVDRERGVVLAEWRRGDDFSRKRLEQQLDFLMPFAYAASRMPIGERAIIETAPRERLVSLYQRYYRPERATMVIVGDFDLATMEEKLNEQFGDWVGEGTPGLDPSLAYVIPERASGVSVFTHKDGGDWIDVSVLSPYVKRSDTAARRHADMLLGVALSAVGRRFEPMQNLDDPPFRAAELSSGDVYETVRIASGTFDVTPTSWKPGLMAVEQEWRRARLFGFTTDEVALEMASIRAAREDLARRESTRTTSALAGGLVGAVQAERVFTAPSEELADFERWAVSVTPDGVQAEFVKWMVPTRPMFFMSTSVPRPNIEAEILAAWDESTEVEVTPPESKEVTPFAYTDFGPPGKVVSDERRDDVGARLVVFENEVRLSIKRTNLQRDAVQVSVRVAGGDLDLPAEPFGLSSLMGAFSEGGLEKHSADELRRILASRRVSIAFDSLGTAFGGSYGTTPRDLELQLAVIAAYTTSAGYRPEAERRWRQDIQLSWPRLDANASTVWNAQGSRLLASGDKRFGTDKDDGETERTFAELKAVLEPRLTQGPIEIAIVGDIEEARAIELVAKTFGALPTREPLQTKFTSDVPVEFRADKTPITLRHAGPTNQALAYVFWPLRIDPIADPQASMVVSVMADVMRLKVLDVIRESLGATYSPSAGAALSTMYPGFGYVSAGAEVRPQDADAVIEALKTIAVQMREGEVSDDELLRAVVPEVEKLPRRAASNAYWLGLISQAQSRPELIQQNSLPGFEALLRNVSREDVIDAARTWLVDDAAQEARVLPAEP